VCARVGVCGGGGGGGGGYHAVPGEPVDAQICPLRGASPHSWLLVSAGAVMSTCTSMARMANHLLSVDICSK
jgi:hypothetical protein